MGFGPKGGVSKAFAKALTESRKSTGGWVEYKPQQCDLCPRMAWWSHPEGGFRCRKCPRPGDDRMREAKR